MTSALQTPPVRTIAEWVPATTRILSDAQKLRSYVDKFLGQNDNHGFLSEPFQAAPRSLGGVPVVESDATPEGTGLVGDFSKAVLYDREQLTISEGTANDDFVRDIVRVLGEVRAAWESSAPAAFTIVDLV